MELDLSSLAFLISLLVFAGVLSGLLSGLFGLGGGVVLVPALYYIFIFLGENETIAMHIAVATSLSLSVPATLFAFQTHLTKKNVNLNLLKSWGITITLGVFLGAYISTLLEGAILMKGFALYLLFVAFIMGRGKAQKPLFPELPKEPWRGISGIIIGCLSSMLGIGGGTLTVPKMTLFGMSMKKAVGTASALSALACTIGTFSHIATGLLQDFSAPYTIGYMNWLIFLVISPISILTARFGARLVEKIPAHSLKRGFALFILILALKLLNDIYIIV